MPGAGHIVHMPAHIYYRVGLYRDSLDANQRAIAVDEHYFADVAVGPAVQGGVLPAQHPLRDGLGADGRRRRRPRSTPPRSSTPRCPPSSSRQFPILQPVKAAPYTTHAQFSRPRHGARAAGAAERAGARRDDVPLRARGRLRAQARTPPAAQRRDRCASPRIEREADFKPFEAWGVPAKEIVQTARLVATGRLADAARRPRRRRQGLRGRDRDRGQPRATPSRRTGTTRCASRSAACACARAGSTTPSSAFRDSLARVRNNGWALAGLVEVARQRGDAHAEQAARAAFERAWFGAKEGPDLSRL